MTLRLGNLFAKVITTTHKCITADPCNAIFHSRIRVGIPQIAPVPLWSVAQRISHDLIIQTSIEYVPSPFVLICMISYCSTALDVGVIHHLTPLLIQLNTTRTIPHTGYWRGLQSYQDFSVQISEDC